MWGRRLHLGLVSDVTPNVALDSQKALHLLPFSPLGDASQVCLGSRLVAERRNPECARARTRM